MKQAFYHTFFFSNSALRFDETQNNTVCILLNRDKILTKIHTKR